MVLKSWFNSLIPGWKAFALMGRIRSPKVSLEVWHKENFGNLDSQFDFLRKFIKAFDSLGNHRTPFCRGCDFQDLYLC